MPCGSDDISYFWNPPTKLNKVKDNYLFQQISSGADKIKFLQDYFYFSLSEATYALHAFKDDAFSIVFDMISLESLEYRRTNPTYLFLSPTIKDMELVRLRRYDEKIVELENRIKLLEERRLE